MCLDIYNDEARKVRERKEKKNKELLIRRAEYETGVIAMLSNDEGKQKKVIYILKTNQYKKYFSTIIDWLNQYAMKRQLDQGKLFYILCSYS